VLKQAEAGLAVAELIRKVGIREQTFYPGRRRTTQSIERGVDFLHGH